MSRSSGTGQPGGCPGSSSRRRRKRRRGLLAACTQQGSSGNVGPGAPAFFLKCACKLFFSLPLSLTCCRVYHLLCSSFKVIFPNRNF